MLLLLRIDCEQGSYHHHQQQHHQHHHSRSTINKSLEARFSCSNPREDDDLQAPGVEQQEKGTRADIRLLMETRSLRCVDIGIDASYRAHHDGSFRSNPLISLLLRYMREPPG